MTRPKLPVIDIFKKVKRLENQVGAVMADPRLDEQQKYRATKRLFAEIDFRTAFRDAFAQDQKALDGIHRLVGLDPDARADYFKRVLVGLVEQCLVIERKLCSRCWQLSKLCILAPWGEVRMFERVVRFAVLLVLNEVLSPVWHVSLRAMLSIMRLREQNT